MMKFKMDVWRNYYNKAHELGKYLKECKDKSEEKVLISELKEIMTASDNYLDACGFKKPVPLWPFDIQNPSTWASHSSFQYQHLLKKEQ